MKYTNFKTVVLMLSASALLVLSGCDGTTGTESGSGLGGASNIVSIETPAITPTETPAITPTETPAITSAGNTTPIAYAGKSQSHVVYVDEKGLIISADAFVNYHGNMESKTSAPLKSKTESLKTMEMVSNKPLTHVEEVQKTDAQTLDRTEEKTSSIRMMASENTEISPQDRNLTVTLGGTQSSDADGDTLTYQWTMVTKPGRSKAALNNTTLAGPSFSADVVGDYVFELTVNDGEVDSQISAVTVSIKTYQQESSKWIDIGNGEEGNTTRTYNAYGQVLTQHYVDSYGSISDYTYTYDTNGNMLTQHYDNGNGYTEDYTYTYDANGNMLTQHYEDSNGYTSDNTYTYTYDANGNMLTYGQDYNADGIVEYLYTYTYDANGNMLTQHYDNVNGYTYDNTYTYDANGNMLTQHYANSYGHTYDNTYTYDANGNMLTQRNKQNYNGSIYSSTYTYTYDANGNMLTQHYDNGDGYTDDNTYTYDANGNMLTQHYADSYGSINDYTYTYDANGNMLIQHYDNGNGYTYDYTYTYDANGNMLTQHSIDSDFNEYDKDYTWVLLP